VLVAFAVGAGAASLLRGALRGLVALVVATLAYYALIRVTGSRPANSAIEHASQVWLAVAVVAGPAAGLAAAIWRYRTGVLRAIAVALVGAVLVTEGLLGLWQVGGPFVGLGSDADSWFGIDPSAAVHLLEVAIGLAMPVVLLPVPRERLIAYGSVGALAIAGIPTAGVALDLLRRLASR
jgi:hypothetical protein